MYKLIHKLIYKPLIYKSIKTRLDANVKFFIYLNNKRFLHELKLLNIN